MLMLDQYLACIVIDGVVRETYAEEYSPEGNSVTCWIASEEGKNFSIHWNCVYRDISVQSLLVIDGVECDRHVMIDANKRPNDPSAVGVWSAKTSPYTRRNFVFSPLEVTNDDNYYHTVDNALNIGTIKLELWRLSEVEVLQHSLAPIFLPSLPNNQVIHERSKKAGAHHVSFGPEYHIGPQVVNTIYSRKMDSTPYMTFIFKYRPMDLLIANGIVPRPIAQPTATMSRAEYHDENLQAVQDAEEIQALEERLRLLRARVSLHSRTIKAEGDQAAEMRIKPEPVSVKLEPSGLESVDLI